jgi:hypothetical protein
VRPEGLGQLKKNPMTSSGIEPATFRLVPLTTTLPRTPTREMSTYEIVAGISEGSGQSMNCLRSLERWDRGFESHSKSWVSVYVFILFMLSCV